MAKSGANGLQRIAAATRYSLSGLRACWRMEVAFRQELVAGLILIPLALMLGEGGVEKALLAGSCLLVLIVEILNSGIEAVVDRFGGERNDLSALAKDLGSAAVLVSIVLLALVWVLVLAY